LRTVILFVAALSLAVTARAEAPAAAAKHEGHAPPEVHATGKPGTAAASRVKKLTAKVKGVDAPNRVLILDVGGKTENVKVDPAVKRFDEIAVGDTIALEYEQALLLEYQPAGAETVQPTVVTAGGKAEPGSAPGAVVAAAVQATVTVTKIDGKTRVVSLTGPEGNVYDVKAGPKVQLEKLKVGDKLLATYAEAVALKVEKKPAAKAKEQPKK
jgi:hypothetical protein